MWIVAGVVVGAIAAGTAVSVMTGESSGHDHVGDTCVTVSLASSMGGAAEHACGAAARDWCRAAYGQHDAHATAVQVRCREAGILQ
jgi:hypothetical protein